MARTTGQVEKSSTYQFCNFCSPIKCFSCSQASSFSTNWILCAVCLFSSSKTLRSISYCCRNTEKPASHYPDSWVLLTNIFAPMSRVSWTLTQSFISRAIQISTESHIFFPTHTSYMAQIISCESWQIM